MRVEIGIGPEYYKHRNASWVNCSLGYVEVENFRNVSGFTYLHEVPNLHQPNIKHFDEVEEYYISSDSELVSCLQTMISTSRIQRVGSCVPAWTCPCREPSG